MSKPKVIISLQEYQEMVSGAERHTMNALIKQLRDRIEELEINENLMERQFNQAREAYEKHIDELEAKIAAMQPDAALGRQVRALPRGYSVWHSVNIPDEWGAGGGRKTDGIGDTPELALDAAGVHGAPSEPEWTKSHRGPEGGRWPETDKDTDSRAVVPRL